MALGAITQNNVSPDSGPNMVIGGLRIVNVTVVGDSSYPTGGSVLTPAQLGLADVVLFSQVEVQALSGTNSTVAAAVYNTATGKLQCFGASAEIANATNLSGATWNIIAFGY